MMDDDAEPEADSLEKLLNIYEADADGNTNIYGSIAITHGDGRFCWPLVSSDGKLFETVDQVPDKVAVAVLPFLGILIPRGVVDKNGYPDPGYFIQGDDAEFCHRARLNGMHVYAAGRETVSGTRPRSSTVSVSVSPSPSASACRRGNVTTRSATASCPPAVTAGSPGCSSS